MSPLPDDEAIARMNVARLKEGPLPSLANGSRARKIQSTMKRTDQKKGETISNDPCALLKAPRLEMLPTDTLIPYARNSRSHSPEQVAQIAGSIREFGFTNPVLIDAENGIIAGHCRVLAAQKLGRDEVPCIRLDHLTETQKRAYIIADNKLALNAGWDEAMLGLELSDLREMDFNLDLTGFDADEVEAALNPPGSDGEGPESPEGNFPEQYAVTVVCDNENHQAKIFDKLTEMGLTCKVVCV